MSDTIVGRIEVPFHGDDGLSAYEIAVRNGYEGTEKDWVESLGFIPDKTIGEEKLSDKLIGKLKEYETFIGSVFDKKTIYEKAVVNEYTEEADEYLVPYKKIGSVKYKIKIPKPGNAVVYDENDDSMWSAESGDYRVCKIDISQYEGEKIKIYGCSNSVNLYPCAFAVDSENVILERYGTEKNTVYGYEKPENWSGSYNYADAIETIVPNGAKHLYISGRWFQTGGVTTCDANADVAFEKIDGFVPNEKYKLMQSPLWGKRLYADGDSICAGNGYAGGYGRIIADRYNMTLENSGVGGATVTSMGATNKVAYADELDWENNTYYLKLVGFDPIANKSADGFAYPIDKNVYENGFGVYPKTYKMVDGELVEQEYSTEMPSETFFVKFDVPTYGENTAGKYYRMWSTNNWLWEAYNSGFKDLHESGTAEIATARHWLTTSVEEIPDGCDYVIFEGGINDYQMNRPMGELSEDMDSAVDITTFIGAMEYLCRRLLEKCIGKKVLYVIAHKANEFAYSKNSNAGGNKTWTDFHDAILSVLKKYSLPVVDLFESSGFNTELASFRKYTLNSDGVHPNKEGYELFYVPQIVKKAEEI